MKPLEPGDEVRWESHGGSGRSRKRGRVLACVPAGVDIEAYKSEYRDSHDLSAVMLSGGPRPAQSYLVEIPLKGRKPRLYWPRAEVLERCDDRVLPRPELITHQARQAPLFRVPPVRRLLDGRHVEATQLPVSIPLATHCPAKWAIVDLETGQAFTYDGKRFRDLDGATRRQVSAILTTTPQVVRGQHLRRRPLRTPSASHPPTEASE